MRNTVMLLGTALSLSLLTARCGAKSGFVKLDASRTNITFNNEIFENDSINIFDFANIYNGDGVGVGDFNNDGLQDLYFTGNMVPAKLYLNKGKMTFEDVTTQSGTEGKGRWNRGVAVIDINNDGWLDLYVCATAKRDPLQRINMLYINRGLGKDKVPVFEDQALQYGLADTTQSTMAYFFDYDNDLDPDLYIGVNHIIQNSSTNVYKKRSVNGEHPSTGRLYRNDWNDSLGHPRFTDVSRQAGILVEGYTHAVNVADFNNDGWQDLFVANDYISSNVLYINNRDGTFTDRVKEYFRHAAANSMGTDAVDINNDGLDDVIEVDMAPQDNYRKKMFLNPISYQSYLSSDQFGYQYQYVRNMLHVNQGHSMGQQDSISHPVFSEVGYLAGIAETDWSWTPVVADFDSDGNRDIIFTNGFPKDITDHDFMVFRQEAFKLTAKKDMLSEIPVVRIPNYAYRNNGDLRFTDMTHEWGLGEQSFSNGAAYADLDNDGDLDLVINNINDPAMVYENRIAAGKPVNYLQVKCKGPQQNVQGLGATVVVHQKNRTQTFRNNPYRGYLSSVSPIIHFGLGNDPQIDSVVVLWPGNRRQVIRDVQANQVLHAIFNKAEPAVPDTPPALARTNWFTNITRSAGVEYVHRQREFIDFNIQKLLPHKFSEYAPGIAAGDINADGLDDFITGGSPGFSPMIFRQQPGGTFSTEPMLRDTTGKRSDDRGLLLFDADGDTDLDLYIASGGYAYAAGENGYRDAFYLNDGKGYFTPDSSAMPANTASKSCVRAADYDRDGDLDLFIAGRVEPWAYPKPASSFLYRNDSQNGRPRFTDVTRTAAPALAGIGLVCDAVFSDYDNDGWPDLVLAGEWMPVTFLRNNKGSYEKSVSTGIENNTGWWNSLAPGDFDNDGDIDYIAGNLGRNSFYRASPEMPVAIRAADFDNNGSYDAIPSLYLPARLEKNTAWKEYPAHTRDDMIKQMIGTRNKYQNYGLYAVTTIDGLLPPEKMNGALKLTATHLSSAYLENQGGGRFILKDLPTQAQFSVINGMIVEDFDGDGNLDVCMNTNDFSADPNVGRYDALNGLMLRGDGKGNFRALSILESGVFIGGDGKGLAGIRGDGSLLMVATQNRGPVEIFRLRQPSASGAVGNDDAYAMMVFRDGRRRKVEFYHGASFLSQSSRFVRKPAGLSYLDVHDSRGRVRRVK